MKRFTVVSCGLTPPGQMTLEALAELRRCGAVHSHGGDQGTAAALRKLGVPAPRAAADWPALAAAVKRSLARHDRVALLAYGNPFFLNHPLAGLLASVSGLAEVGVLPGVSSFDALTGLFGIGGLPAGGLLCLDLNFAGKGTRLDPGLDIFCFAPFRLNLRWNAARRRAFLAEAARRYPASHPAFLARCGQRGAEVLRAPLRRLGELLKRAGTQHTLVLLSAERARRLGALTPAPAITDLPVKA